MTVNSELQIDYLIPPANERIGGIDTAIEGLSHHLRVDCNVRIHTGASMRHQTSQLCHFHGLWQPQHLPTYRRCQADGIPYVVSPHGMLEPWAWNHKLWKKWPYYQLIERRNLRKADAVFAASELEAANLGRFVDPAKIIVLPFGLNATNIPSQSSARQRLNLSDTEKVILYLSRIDQKKGLDLLLNSLLGANAEGQTLLVVGDDSTDFAVDMKDFATRHSNQLPSIRWVGPVWEQKRWDYFAAADLFALPTRSENFGFAVLEAVWAGTPTLTTTATPWAAHRDVDHVHICEPTVESVRAKVLEIQNAKPSDTDRRQLSHWFQQNYHWTKVSSDYASVYLELVRRSKRFETAAA